MWQRTQERLKQWQPRLIILFTVKRTLIAGWHEQVDINLLSYNDGPNVCIQTVLLIIHLLCKSEVVRQIKSNYRCFKFFQRIGKYIIDNEE